VRKEIEEKLLQKEKTHIEGERETGKLQAKPHLVKAIQKNHKSGRMDAYFNGE
jgi:hypothetical protein